MPVDPQLSQSGCGSSVFGYDYTVDCICVGALVSHIRVLTKAL